MKLKTLLAAALAASAVLLNARADTTNGLVLYYNLNETSGTAVADSSGLGNNGTIIANTNPDFVWTNGWSQGALCLSGSGYSSNYITAPDSASLNFTNQRAYTIALWVKLPTTQVNGGAIIAKGTGGGGEQYDLDFNASKYRLVVRNAGGAAVTASSTANYTANVWQHVVAVCDVTSTNAPNHATLKIYLNGQLNTTVTNDASLGTGLRYSTSPLVVGCRQSAAAAYNLAVTNAVLDDVRLYNRALSASDVYEVYSLNGKLPLVTAHARSVTNYVGDYAPFNVTVDLNNSTQPVSYQWQWYGTNLPGATGATLVLTNVQLANSGPYSVIVSNVVGLTNSAAYLQVQSLPAADVTSGLAGYWKFDDAPGSLTAADASGNGNSATLSFADYTACWVTGITNGALFFNTNGLTTDRATIPADGVPAPPGLDFYANPAFTLAAWVKGSAPQTNGGAIIAKGTGNGGEQFSLDVNGGTFRFYVRNTNAANFNLNTTTPANGTWQHVAAAFDAINGVMAMYVNGQLVNVTVAPLNLLSNAHEVSIGNRQSGAATAYNLPFTGAIDDVRIYNRALTAADIQALYATGGLYPPSFSLQPVGASLFVGDNYQFSATVGGTVPISLQWRTNGVKLTGATNTTLTFLNLQTNNAASYTLFASNAYGMATSSVAVLQISPWMLTDALSGEWNFDETNGISAADASPNGNVATLSGLPGDDTQWITGRIGGALRLNSYGLTFQYAGVPDAASLNFTNNLRFTISAWVRGPATQISGACIVTKGIGSLNEQYSLDVSAGLYRFYVRNSAGTVSAINPQAAPNGLWQHLVATCDGGVGLMNFYVNGQLIASTNVAPNSLLANDHLVSIGAREQNSTSGYNFYFVGDMDDVRLYSRALSLADVQTLYNAAGFVAPVFYTQPFGAARWVGDNHAFSAVVDGTPPLVYQWLKNGTGLTGATNATLLLTNLQTGDAGTYTLQVTNLGGPTLSSNAVLQVNPFTLANTVGYWKFDDGTGQTAADSSGFGNPGTLNNFPFDDSEWVAGRLGKALNFHADGVSPTYVNVPDSGNFNFATNLTFSVAAWVRGPAAQGGSAGVVAKGYGAGQEQFCIDVFNGNYRFFVRMANATAPAVASAVAPNGRWQHLVGTFDGVIGTMALYINGQFVGSVAATSLTNHNHEVSIGNREGNASSGYNNPFQGLIDDVRIYSRALTASEALQLYQLPGPLGPTLYTQPQSTTRYTYDSVSFTASGDGTDPLSYQWRKGGVPIAGATTTILLLPSLKLGDAGAYSFQLTDASSGVVSTNAVLTVQALPPPDLTNELIAYWAFDETNGSTTVDSSGHGNNASLLEFPTDDSEWVPGVIGGALRFSAAASANYRVAVDNPIGLDNPDQFTFSFWAKLDPGASGLNPRFITPIGTAHWVLWTPGRGVGFYTPGISTQPSSNAWHQFVVLYNRPAGTYSLFVDGVRQVTELGGYVRPDPTYPSASYWIIGHSETATSTTDSWTGLLDDLRMYNRFLNYNDIQALYYLAPLAQPTLAFTSTATTITLSWPIAATGFHLQKAQALAGPGSGWSDETTSTAPSPDGAMKSVTLSTDQAARFYRLAKP